MKITFTLQQLQEYERMAPEQRRQFISSCEKLQTLNDDELPSFYMPTDTRLAMTVYKKVKRRYNFVTRRRQRAAQKATQAVQSPDNTNLPYPPEPAHVPEAMININDDTADTAVWVYNHFNKLVDKVLTVIRMVTRDTIFSKLAHTWDRVTNFVYRMLQPVFEACALYVDLPDGMRSPDSVPLESFLPRTYPSQTTSRPTASGPRLVGT